MQYEGFVVYRSFYEAIEKIPEEEQLIAYKIMMDYALNDALPEDMPLSVDIIFGLIKPQIDKNRERAANGRKGGRKKKTEKVEKPQVLEEKQPENEEKTEKSCQKSLEVVGKDLTPEPEKSEETEKTTEAIHRTDYKKIIDIYHECCPSLSKVVKVTEKRKTAIRARLRSYTEDELRKCFEMAERSRFLRGEKGGWKANFDWLMNENNIAKVLEGTYEDNEKKPGPQKSNNQFHNLEERGYSPDYFTALEERLTGGRVS